LTNNENGDSKEVVESYISRWPYFGDQQNSDQGKTDDGKNTIQKYGKLQPSDKFFEFVEMIDKYCQNHFFRQKSSGIDANDCSRAIYDLSGSLYESEGFILVSLEAPAAFPYRNELEDAIRRVNGRHIFDNQQRKLWLEA